MNQAATTGRCANCVVLEARLAQALARLAQALARVAELEAQVAELLARLAKLEKNSTNSSKPPSSDIVKPPLKKRRRRGGKKKRRIGGQPGHPKHERPAFTEDEVDRTWDYFWDRCPDCDGPLNILDPPASVVQQIELVVRPIRVSEHRSRECFCHRCQKTFIAPLPREIRKAGLVGPRLTALVGYLKGACHCSFSVIRKYLRDVLQTSLSRGQLRKVCGKVASSMNDAYDELLAALPQQSRLNTDETGHKENGQSLWTWCFRAPLYTLFKIDESRGSDVLIETLGLEFNGVLHCDYFSAYRKYMRLNENVMVQFCLAHLIRDVKFLVEHPDAKNRAYGQRLLASLQTLFKIIHRRETYATGRTFQLALERQAADVLEQATTRVPKTREAQTMHQRFEKHGFEYLQFVTTPNVDPTNNLAEQAIRFVVIDRRITQGTRGASGRRWSERIWTAIATCAQQGRSVFQFLTQSIAAHFQHRRAPSLLPDTS